MHTFMAVGIRNGKQSTEYQIGYYTTEGGAGSIPVWNTLFEVPSFWDAVRAAAFLNGGPGAGTALGFKVCHHGRES